MKILNLNLTLRFHLQDSADNLKKDALDADI